MIGLHSRSVTNEIDCKCHGVFSYSEPVSLTLSRVVGPLKRSEWRKQHINHLITINLTYLLLDHILTATGAAYS